VTLPGPAALLAVLAVTTACRESKPALDPAMTSCIPRGTVVVAGLDLEAIRAAPVYSKLPPPVLALIESLQRAHYAILAFDGHDLLAISRGPFAEPPPGATLLTPHLAIAGPAGLVRAATSQYGTGTTGVPDLVEPAKVLAGAKPIWIVVRGSGVIPLGGNSANLNRLLHATRHTTVAVELRERLDLEVTALCLTPDAGREFEQSLRAILTLTATANARQPVLAALLRSIQIRRDDRTVHVTVAVAADDLDGLLQAF